VSHQESLDTSTPMGKAMFTVIAAMAELERGNCDLLKQRHVGRTHCHTPYFARRMPFYN